LTVFATKQCKNSVRTLKGGATAPLKYGARDDHLVRTN